MLIDLVRTESWEDLNDKLKDELKLESDLRLRTYRGVGHGVYEICHGAAQFMSHKKAIGVVSGQMPFFETLLPFFYKEMFEVQSIRHLDLINPKDWVANLKRDTNFVIFAEDHPVTGEKYNFIEELDQELNKRRITSIRISHASHFFQNAEIGPYTIRLCSYGVSMALAILGERFKAPPLIAQSMDWDFKNLVSHILSLRSLKLSTENAVRQFEKDLSSISRPFFDSLVSRNFDRAVCIFPNVSASALAVEIFKQMKISEEEGWQQISTANLCHWSVTKMFNNWWMPSQNANDLRGLLVFSSDLIKKENFSKLVIACHEEIVKKQSWSL